MGALRGFCRFSTKSCWISIASPVELQGPHGTHDTCEHVKECQVFFLHPKEPYGHHGRTEVQDRGRFGEGTLMFFVFVGCSCASWGGCPPMFFSLAPLLARYSKAGARGS